MHDIPALNMQGYKRQRCKECDTHKMCGKGRGRVGKGREEAAQARQNHLPKSARFYVIRCGDARGRAKGGRRKEAEGKQRGEALKTLSGNDD